MKTNRYIICLVMAGLLVTSNRADVMGLKQFDLKFKQIKRLIDQDKVKDLTTDQVNAYEDTLEKMQQSKINPKKLAILQSSFEAALPKKTAETGAGAATTVPATTAAAAPIAPAAAAASSSRFRAFDVEEEKEALAEYKENKQAADIAKKELEEAEEQYKDAKRKKEAAEQAHDDEMQKKYAQEEQVAFQKGMQALETIYEADEESEEALEAAHDIAESVANSALSDDTAREEAHKVEEEVQKEEKELAQQQEDWVIDIAEELAQELPTESAKAMEEQVKHIKEAASPESAHDLEERLMASAHSELDKMSAAGKKITPEESLKEDLEKIHILEAEKALAKKTVSKWKKKVQAAKKVKNETALKEAQEQMQQAKLKERAHSLEILRTALNQANSLNNLAMNHSDLAVANNQVGHMLELANVMLFQLNLVSEEQQADIKDLQKQYKSLQKARGTATKGTISNVFNDAKKLMNDTSMLAKNVVGASAASQDWKRYTYTQSPPSSPSSGIKRLTNIPLEGKEQAELEAESIK